MFRICYILLLSLIYHLIILYFQEGRWQSVDFMAGINDGSAFDPSQVCISFYYYLRDLHIPTFLFDSVVIELNLVEVRLFNV